MCNGTLEGLHAGVTSETAIFSLAKRSGNTPGAIQPSMVVAVPHEV